MYFKQLPESDFNKNTSIFIEKITFENVGHFVHASICSPIVALQHHMVT